MTQIKHINGKLFYENKDFDRRRQMIINQTGKNRPSAKLVRFIKKARRTASLKRSLLAGKELNKKLSINQISISATNRAGR